MHTKHHHQQLLNYENNFIRRRKTTLCYANKFLIQNYLYKWKKLKKRNLKEITFYLIVHNKSIKVHVLTHNTLYIYVCLCSVGILYSSI